MSCPKLWSYYFKDFVHRSKLNNISMRIGQPPIHKLTIFTILNVYPNHLKFVGRVKKNDFLDLMWWRKVVVLKVNSFFYPPHVI